MEGQVKFFNTQNTAGVFKEAGVVISQTIVLNGDQNSNVKKIYIYIIKS